MFISFKGMVLVTMIFIKPPQYKMMAANIKGLVD
jgi:hypothetical protein